MQKLPDFANSENTSRRYFLNMRGEKVSNVQETFHMLIPNLFTMHLPLMLWRYPGSAKYLKALAVLSKPVELASVKVNFGERERIKFESNQAKQPQSSIFRIS